MTGKLLAIARRQRPRADLEQIARAVVSLERGIEGDARGGVPGRQLTIVFKEDWAAACGDLGRQLPWTTRRANLLIEGLHGFKRVGARIKVGTVLLEVCEETDPCSLMEAQAKGLRAALQPNWRGGVSCNVLTPGEIAVDDRVEVVESASG